MMIRRAIVRSIFLALVLLLFPGILPSAFGEMTPVQYWMVGTRFADNKLFIDAINNYTLAIRNNNGEMAIEEVARVFDDRGLAYAHLGQDDKALSDYNNAIELDDKNAEHFVHRGRFYLDRKQYEKAQDDFAVALRIAPDNAEAHEGRGRASLESGEHDQAIVDYAKVVSLEPRNVDAWYRLGLAYKGAEKDEHALETFDRVIKAAGTHPDAEYQKAGIFARQKKIDSACVWIGIAVQDGFRDWAMLKNDSDFDSIRDNPCYLKIVAGK